MSFRKRNIAVASPGKDSSRQPDIPITTKIIPGLRPSPLDGRITTSTGTRSLDSLLAGHAGLALGSSLLIEESGTTDFGGALLKYYAAEGLVQGHHVHVLGMNESWSRDLPGLSTTSEGRASKTTSTGSTEKMKIAWRYERLGEFGKGMESSWWLSGSMLIISIDRSAPLGTSSAGDTSAALFCHDFDLGKRLEMPSSTLMKCVPPILPRLSSSTNNFPFAGFLEHLTSQLHTSSPSSIHRVIIPTFLSPAVYQFSSPEPHHVLPFLHGLRAILRKYPTQLTAMITIPLSLFPRSSGLTRWIEALSDGVLELAPFPANALPLSSPGGSTSSGQQEDPPQGILKVHRLPVFHEKGGGGGEGVGDDMAFNLSRRKGLCIKPYSLPPVHEDAEMQQLGLVTAEGGKAAKADIEF